MGWGPAFTAIGSGAIASGNIASGQIGWPHLASGAILSGVIASGQVGNFHLASGGVQGSLGAGARNIASGTIGQDDIGAGAIVSGHIASGNIITYARSVYLDNYVTSEIVSGVRCVQPHYGASGLVVRVAMAAVSGRMPAFGVAFGNALSGQSISVVRYGNVLGPSAQIGSGLCISGRTGRALFVGASGQLVTVSGGGPTIGVGATNSGSFGQRIGWSTASGAVLVDPNPQIITSGAASITTNPAFWPA